MMRSAVPLPPSSEATALVTIASGIVAVSAPEASAIARSKPATFWNRLTTRSTNSGRSQNVSVRTTRSRSTRRRRCSFSSSGSSAALKAREYRVRGTSPTTQGSADTLRPMTGDDPLERLPSSQLHDMALHRARRHLDVRFFPGNLMQLLPTAEASVGQLDAAETDVLR